MILRRLLPFAFTTLFFTACSDPEDCATIGDEDADGLADCQDSECSDRPECAPEICDNGIDDNQNGAVDCQESSCATQIRCQPETLCDDGIDNNQNGDIDCADDDCSVSDPCIEVDECDDDLDNDNDGETDCDDSDCGADPACFPETDCGQGAFNCCSDGQDNNGDGTTDCADPTCAAPCVTLNCGNGQLNAGESCDDGNNTSGDCCSSDCSDVTCDAEIEPNNTSGEATGPLEIPASIAGSINPGTEDDFYSVNLTLPGKIRYETSDGSGLGSCVNADTTVTAFNTNGTSVIGSATGGGVGLCAVFVTPNVLQPGTYFVKVESGLNNNIPIYQLHVSGIICGNGTIDPNSAEECDNGLHCSDLTPCVGDAECTAIGDGLCIPRTGDGCDAICKREPLCGDNILTSPPELCEDGSTCSDGTTICNGNASLCVGIGDGSCTPKSGDGCDSNCTITACGNNVATAPEECDDGKTCPDGFTSCTNNANCTGIGNSQCTAKNGDGCDNDCTFSVCGNGIVGAPEQCDQTNLNGASCVSLGFASGALACNTAGCIFDASSCVASICGNGVTETGEECDDGNVVNGDSCSAGCLFEIILESEVNDISAQADGPFTSPFLAEGGLSPATEADFYSFTLSATGSLRIETFDGNGPPTCDAIDTKVDLFPPSGTTAIIVDDNDGAGNCSLINPNVAADAAARNLAPGTYFIKVAKGAAAAATAPSYRLQVSLAALCGNNVTETAAGEGCDDGNLISGDGCDSICRAEVCGNNRLDANEQCEDNNTNNGDCCSSTCQIEAGCVFETEANNSAATANGPLGDGNKVAANITPAADADFFSLVIPNRVDLKLETQNLTNTNCSTTQDTVLDFINTNGTTLIATSNDISGTNRCSRLDGTEGAAGSLSTMKALAPGTYFIKVIENGNNGAISNYRLLVDFASLCGDGVVESSEPCDDGNQTPGDGCENNCIITPACGNNVIEPGEECDGGNNVPGDGCDALCQREPTCGDNFVDSPETCDDGNTANGDCCSSGCQIEPACIAEIEPNGSTATATGPLTGGNTGFGAITPVGDLDFYSLVIPAEADLQLETTNGTATPCALTTHDTVLKFIAPNGTTIATNNDISGTNRCSRLDPVGSASMRNLAPGTYFFSVEENGNNGTIARYHAIVTFTSLCGNNIQEPNEACDDGNLADGDGCEANCTITPACGNLLTEGNEQCDDGKHCADGAACTLDSQCVGIGDGLCSARSGDGCDSLCRDEFCGDQITNDINETCDDGNVINTDACLNTCRLAACGDGIIFGVANGGPEECDNGALNSDTNTNACRTDCTLPRCGDGAIDTGELCDDGNTFAGDGCDATCDIEFCGDGIDNATIDLNGDGDSLDAGESSEECDDGNASNADGCTNFCEVAACGDSFIFNTEGGDEQCDDGDLNLGDGCDAFCFVEQTSEIEPNNSIAEAQASAINITFDQLLTGAINPVGDSDFYRFTLPAPRTMHIETFDAAFGSCVSINTVIEVFNSAGTKLTTADGGGIGLCGSTNISLGAGTFFVRVFESGNNATIPAYSLFIDFP